MDYVSGCARTIQVTPGRWSVQGIGRYCLWNIWVYVWNWKGSRKSTPVESNGMSEMSLVDRQLRNVWANGIRNNLPRSNGRLSVVMRWVYAAENYPDRRSVRCKQGIGRWNMQTVGAWRWMCWLADLDTTVGLVTRGALHVFVILVCCLGNVSGLGKCNSITGLGQRQTCKWEC